MYLLHAVEYAYQNLILVKADIHKLIHATKQDTIAYYMERINPDPKQLDKVNRLRIEAKLIPIEI